jgi:hypothetical protein
MPEMWEQEGLRRAEPRLRGDLKEELSASMGPLPKIDPRDVLGSLIEGGSHAGV